MDAPSPAMRRLLRQARVYGYLQALEDRLFHPGGTKSLCRVETAEEMARAGWLKRDPTATSSRRRARRSWRSIDAWGKSAAESSSLQAPPSLSLWSSLSGSGDPGFLRRF